MANQGILCGVSLLMWFVWLVTSKYGTDNMAGDLLHDVAHDVNEEISARWSEYVRQLMLVNLMHTHKMMDLSNSSHTRVDRLFKGLSLLNEVAALALPLPLTRD
jgi:hypothetical protein